MSIVSRNLSVFDVLNSKMAEIQDQNKPIGEFTDFVASELDLLEKRKNS